MRDNTPPYRVEYIGDCELHLGDCREILPLLGRVDAVVTDPPYLDGDFSDTLPLMPAERIVLTPGKLESFNWISRKAPTWEFIWRGSQKNAGGRACMAIGFEPVLSYGWPLRPLGTDVLSYPITSNIGNAPESGHPWPKPLAFIEKLIWHWSNPSQIILDPFMGSGTTGAAAVKLGRKFIGIEINPKYFDIACKRIDAAHAQPDMFAPPKRPQTPRFAEFK